MATIKIALDAGHGFNTAGKQTPDGIKEWSLNDKVCDMVEELLKGYDLQIIRLDNNEGETDEPLAKRYSKYINAGVSLLVSIHHNALNSTWSSATGVEIYTDKKPTKEDRRLAELIYKKLVSYTGLKGRGVKKENWFVINQNKIPAVLCEGGFMDGTNDYKIITSKAGQEAYAKAVAEGIVEFLGLAPKTTAEQQVDIIYQVWDGFHKKWLPNVKNCEDYAGIFGHSICGIFANLSVGNVTYKVHYKGGKWLPEVKNRTDYAGLFGQSIDGVMLKSDTKKVRYRVHLKKSGKWLPWVIGYDTQDPNNGFAGILGQEIDGFQAEVI